MVTNMTERKRILILSETASQTDRLRESAEKLALDVVLGCRDSSGKLQLDFDTRDSALAIVSFVQQLPVVAIIPVEDSTGPVAARAASMLRFPFHSPKAADACKDRQRLVKTLNTAGIAVCSEVPPHTANSTLTTVHCLMADGRLRVLAATAGEKPPFAFESMPAETRQHVIAVLKRTIPALGLKHGPVRLSLLTSPEPAVAAVSDTYMPDHYTRTLHFQIPLVDLDISFEELAIRNALGLDTSRTFLKMGNIGRN